MKIKITSEMLENLGVCKSGYDDFIRVTGGIYEAEWTLEEQLKLLKTDLRKWYSWAVKVNIVPMWGMVGVDLSNADLSNANLNNINLSDANLSGTNLEFSRLCDAYLYRTKFRNSKSFMTGFHYSYLFMADFSNADLTCCNFLHANLAYANFTNSNLELVRFSYANLSDVDLSMANLDRALFDKAIVNKNTKFPEGFDRKRLRKEK